MSQPARAVWIEIFYDEDKTEESQSHSLRGLCGLKFTPDRTTENYSKVTACEGCVD